MNIKLGYPEALLAFSAVSLSFSFTLAITSFCLSIAGAITRMSIDYSEKQQEHKSISDGAKILTETLQNVIAPKNDRSLH